MKKTISSHALAAKNLRKELKAAFPAVKFSVTSQCFAGGDAVRVNYTDGPRYDDVDNIARKYQYGSFDGMVDLYTYDSLYDDSRGGAKYVTVNRHLSDAAMQTAADKLGLDPNDYNYDIQRQIRNELDVYLPPK